MAARSLLALALVAALLLPGCAWTPDEAGPGTDPCAEAPRREPGHDAPLVPFLQGEWRDVLDRFLALVGDPVKGTPTGTDHGTGPLATTFWRVPTQRGEAWVTVQEGHGVVHLQYNVDGYLLPHDEAALRVRLEALLADAGIEGLPIETGLAFTHNSFGDSGGLEATASLRLGNLPVARFTGERWPAEVAASAGMTQDWRTYRGDTQFRETRIAIGALVELPPREVLLPPGAAAARADEAVRCALRSSPLLPSEVRAFAKQDTLYHHRGSLGWLVSVEYGDPCPSQAMNTGRQWEAWVLVDARTGAILHTGQGQWNCIGVQSPMEAALPTTSAPSGRV